MRRRALAGVVLMALLIPAGSAHAAPTATATKLTFSTPGFQWFTTSGLGPYFVSRTGDYWAQTFSATGLAHANQYFLTLDYVNTLPKNKQISVILMVNGVFVGEMAIGSRCCTGAIFYSNPISGPDYDVQLIVNHYAHLGEGGVSLNIGGPSFLRIRYHI